MTRCASLLLLFLPTLAPAAEVTGGPMLGATDHASSWVWARADGAGQLVVRYRAGEQDDWRATAPVAFAADADWTARVALTGLRPSTRYTYSLQVDGVAVPGGPWTLRTLPPPGRGKVSLAFGSCIHQGRFPQQPVWGALDAAAPDAFVFLGDNVYYARDDWTTPQNMWARMRAQRELPELRRFLTHTPALAQWDDHDYGPNNSDRTYAHKDYARHVFRSYWVNPSYGEDEQGIYTQATLGPVDLFLCDDRYFRDPNKTPDGPTKTLLGARQREWLIEALAASAAPVKLVATGMQFLADYHFFESWQLGTHERTWILEQINARDIQGVIFLSGDRHMAEVIKCDDAGPGYDLWEVTSSPLANRTTGENLLGVNARRVYAQGTRCNFGWVEVDADAGTVKLELRDDEGQTLWSAAPDLGLKPAAGKRYFKK